MIDQQNCIRAEQGLALLRFGFIGFEQDQHTLDGAQIQVGSRDHLDAAGEGQTAVGDLDILRANALELKAGSGFAAKIAGCDQLILVGHGSSFLFLSQNKPAPTGTGKLDAE